MHYSISEFHALLRPHKKPRFFTFTFALLLIQGTRRAIAFVGANQDAVVLVDG